MRKRGRKSYSEITNRTEEQRMEFQEEITVIFSPGTGEICVKISLSFGALGSIILGRATDRQTLRMSPVHEVTNVEGRVSQEELSLVYGPPSGLT